MKKNKHYLSLLLLIIAFLPSCSDNKQNTTTTEIITLSEYEQGYEQGYDVAFDVAYDYAVYLYSNDANPADKPTNPNISSINENSEFLRGYKDGYAKGLDEGYLWGVEEAEYISQNAVEESALNAVIAEHPFIADVLQHAEEIGEENGYCEGYDEGYNEGYNKGYDDGYDDATEGD